MILVMLRHTITGPKGLVAVEEQDTVYLEAKRNAPAPAEKPVLAPTAEWRDAWKPDPVVLFRFLGAGLQRPPHRLTTRRLCPRR